jgi:cytochrome c oxidase subunit II
MGISVPDFGVRATIVPGQVAEFRMTPTKTGEFTFLCDVFRGSGHENIDGTLRVVD